MKKTNTLLILSVLAFGEIIFLGAAVSPVRPRRVAELTALTRYQRNPSSQTREILREEQLTSERQARFGRAVAWILAVANGAAGVIVWRLRKPKP